MLVGVEVERAEAVLAELALAPPELYIFIAPLLRAHVLLSYHFVQEVEVVQVVIRVLLLLLVFLLLFGFFLGLLLLSLLLLFPLFSLLHVVLELRVIENYTLRFLSRLSCSTLQGFLLLPKFFLLVFAQRLGVLTGVFLMVVFGILG